MFFNEDYPNDDGKGIFKELKNNCDKMYGKHITQTLPSSKLELLRKKEEELEKLNF